MFEYRLLITDTMSNIVTYYFSWGELLIDLVVPPGWRLLITVPQLYIFFTTANVARWEQHHNPRFRALKHITQTPFISTEPHQYSSLL